MSKEGEILIQSVPVIEFKWAVNTAATCADDLILPMAEKWVTRPELEKTNDK